MRYALYKAGVFQRHQYFDTPPEPLAAEKQMEWVADSEVPPAPLTLEQRKALRREYVNALRAEKETAGFPYLGHVFDSDQRSADRLQVAALAAHTALAMGQPFNVDWVAADNVAVPLDAAGVMGLLGAFASYGLALHETAQVLKAQINAAATAEEVEAIVWPV